MHSSPVSSGSNPTQESSEASSQLGHWADGLKIINHGDIRISALVEDVYCYSPLKDLSGTPKKDKN
jgi:hypothetical protein